MSKFIVAVFPGENQAYEGTRALNALHAEGHLTLYSMAVVVKDANGKFSVKESADAGPLGTAVGALVGGLIGVIGGPIGALAGMGGGSVIGSLVDLFNYGVGEDFITKVSKELSAGKTAIIAEIVENWTTPLDTRMQAVGGTVLRTWRADFEDEQVAKEAATTKAEFEELKVEYAQASAETKTRLKARLDHAKADFQNAQSRLQARLDALEKEMGARIAALEKQVTDAQADAKEKIRQRIAAARTDYEARSSKLKQAWALTKEALAA